MEVSPSEDETVGDIWQPDLLTEENFYMQCNALALTQQLTASPPSLSNIPPALAQQPSTSPFSPPLGLTRLVFQRIHYWSQLITMADMSSQQGQLHLASVIGRRQLRTALNGTDLCDER